VEFTLKILKLTNSNDCPTEVIIDFIRDNMNPILDLFAFSEVLGNRSGCVPEDAIGRPRTSGQWTSSRQVMPCAIMLSFGEQSSASD